MYGICKLKNCVCRAKTQLKGVQGCVTGVFCFFELNKFKSFSLLFSLLILISIT